MGVCTGLLDDDLFGMPLHSVCALNSHQHLPRPGFGEERENGPIGATEGVCYPNYVLYILDGCVRSAALLS